MAAYILKIASSSSSPFAVFTSSSCTSGLNSTCRGRGQRDFERTCQALPHGLSTWAAHLRLLLLRELIVIAVTITSGLAKRLGGGAKRRGDRSGSSRRVLQRTPLSTLSVHLTSLWPCRSHPVGTGTQVLGLTARRCRRG